MDVIRASARLPGLDIEIVHRRAAEDGTEEISIGLRAIPRVEVFIRAFEATGLWTHAMQSAWQPCLVATRVFAVPGALGLPPPSGGASRSAEERGSPDSIVGLRAHLGLSLRASGSCLDQDGRARCLSTF
jgi:hypothetical protein